LVFTHHSFRRSKRNLRHDIHFAASFQPAAINAGRRDEGGLASFPRAPGQNLGLRRTWCTQVVRTSLIFHIGSSGRPRPMRAPSRRSGATSVGTGLSSMSSCPSPLRRRAICRSDRPPPPSTAAAPSDKCFLGLDGGEIEQDRARSNGGYGTGPRAQRVGRGHASKRARREDERARRGRAGGERSFRQRYSFANHGRFFASRRRMRVCLGFSGADLLGSGSVPQLAEQG